jgi:exodeoxyribonuclease VII small subunit
MNHVNEPIPTVPRSSKTPSAADTADAPPIAASYEAALQELEQLVSQLDAGQLPLDQLLTRYQRGAELLAFCRARLEAVENQIKVLEGGELKPWDAA